MLHDEIIQRGRALANGDGVMIDTERAYMLWSTVADELAGDDLSLFLELRLCFGQNFVDGGNGRISEFSMCAEKYRGSLSSFESVTEYAAATPRTKDEVREAFEALLRDADTKTLSKLYTAIARVSADMQAKKEPLQRKPEHINLGNNLGFFMHQYHWNRSVFLEKINKLINPLNASMSSAALSQIINGIHGMNPATQLMLVEMVNAADGANKTFNASAEKENRYRRDQNRLVYKPSLKRALSTEDLHASLSNLVALYDHPRTDEKIKRLLGLH